MKLRYLCLILCLYGLTMVCPSAAQQSEETPDISSTPAAAQQTGETEETEETEETPAMSVVFDQEEVTYTDKLTEVVTTALEADENAAFEIVATIPVKGPRRMDKKRKKRVAEYARAVQAHIAANAGAETRIDLRYEHDTEIESPVVKIFVR